MKKLILPVILFIFVIVLAFSATITPVFAADELWSKGTSVYKVQREGSSLTLIETKPSVQRAAGIPTLVGTITGTTFTGKQYLLADSCPNFERYVPASGTVSADGSSITVTFTRSAYYTESCTIKNEFEDSRTYTKISQQNSPTPSTPTKQPSPTPSETPLDLNGTWFTVNEFGTSFTFSGRHLGNNLSLKIIDATEVKDSIGKTSLSGTLSGHSFSGTQILIPYEQKCLGRYFNSDATGTVAEDGSSIMISFTNFKYNAITCVKLPGTEFAGSVTYYRKDAEKNASNNKDPRKVSPSPEITNTAEKPSVGVSSKDFRELVRANAEYQKAKAELEEIKKANDPRYDAKKDFPVEYKAKLDEIPSEKTKDSLKIVRTGLERLRDAGSAYSDIKDIRDALKGDFGSDGGFSLASDLIGGATDFIDLVDEGVTMEDAAAKVGIDTVTTNALYAIPILKAADTVLNLPDKIANVIGIDEKNWYRERSTGFLKDHSINSFVKLSTSAMIETGSWTNLGGALQVAWDDVKEAKGFGEKANATLDLVGTAVGAVPVAVAMQLRDDISGVFTVMKLGANGAGNYIASWFTFSN